MPENVAYNMDCMEYMRTLPDKAEQRTKIKVSDNKKYLTSHVEHALCGLISTIHLQSTVINAAKSIITYGEMQETVL